MSVILIAISPKHEMGYAIIGSEVWQISPYIKGGIHSSSEDELRDAIIYRDFKKCNMEFELLHQAWDWMSDNEKC
jgi:hypothetical protein